MKLFGLTGSQSSIPALPELFIRTEAIEVPLMEGRHTLTMADLIASVGVHRFFASVAAGFPFHTRRALALGHLQC